MFILIPFILCEAPPSTGSVVTESAVGIAYVDQMLAANTTFTNCTFDNMVFNMHHYELASQNRNEFAVKQYKSNITFNNCDMSNAVFYKDDDFICRTNAQCERFLLNYNVTIINSTIGTICSEYSPIIRIKRLCFMNCTINITTTFMYAVPEMEFYNCTFVGKPPKKSEDYHDASFIRIYKSSKSVTIPDSDDGINVKYAINFFDCIFNLDSMWNYADYITKSNARQFLFMDSYSGKARGDLRSIAFVRCVTGNNMLRSEDPLHFIRVASVTTEDKISERLSSENIMLSSGKEKQNGIGFALSMCDGIDIKDCFDSEYNASDWYSVISNTNYERPQWVDDNIAVAPTPQKKEVLWKTLTVLFAATTVVALVILTVFCIVKRKHKYDRSSNA